MDVINAAKKISEAGTKLDKLTRQIADQCPESSTKKDLLAYLQRIALYCHQLNITSKVKADVQNISGELIVSGVSVHINSIFESMCLDCHNFLLSYIVIVSNIYYLLYYFSGLCTYLFLLEDFNCLVVLIDLLSKERFFEECLL